MAIASLAICDETLDNETKHGYLGKIPRENVESWFQILKGQPAYINKLLVTVSSLEYGKDE